MSRVKIGLIGVGKLGGYHSKALSLLPDVELVGVYDLDPDRTKEVAVNADCKAFESEDALLDAVDAVGIIVPTTFHLETARRALERGKPVFVEKPISSTVSEAEELVTLAQKLNLPLQVGHIERFNPAIRALNGHSIRPMFVESHRLAPFDPRGTDVAVVLDLMIHDIDIILSLVDSKVVKIDANGVAVVSDQLDIANARIQFENGCVANVTASRISQKKMRKMRLFQRDSYVSVDFLQRSTELFKLVDSSDSASTVVLGHIEKGTTSRQIVYDRPVPPEDDAMQAEWKNFVHSVRTGTDPLVSGKDGLRALKVATEITRIIESNVKI
jgi:predicted dehydrogenase